MMATTLTGETRLGDTIELVIEAKEQGRPDGPTARVSANGGRPVAATTRRDRGRLRFSAQGVPGLARGHAVVSGSVDLDGDGNPLDGGMRVGSLPRDEAWTGDGPGSGGADGHGTATSAGMGADDHDPVAIAFRMVGEITTMEGRAGPAGRRARCFTPTPSGMVGTRMPWRRSMRA